MLIKRQWGLLSYLNHTITSAAPEGMNSRIPRLSGNARGLRSFETLRTTVLIVHGKLNMAV